ncbi:MAG TPA: nucleotidyltransferase family protein [Herpetosiphonaceae bacterium]
MIAGVLLAAGRSQRMGQPKLLLPWRGLPLVRYIAQQALSTQLDELLVVVGHRAEHMLAALDGLDVRIVRNERFLDGQSTSLGAGIAAVGADVSAALVLLADQPLLQPQTIDALLDVYRREHPPIVVPRYDGQRGNPVLFDSALFPELRAITGDRGARDVIMAHQDEIRWLDTTDRGILLDIDTPDTYERLIEQSGVER